MRTSEQFDLLAAALVAVQAKLTNPTKDSEAKVASAKGSFQYDYLSLPGLLDVARPALTAQKIALVQSPWMEGDRLCVTTRLLHASGQWVEDTLSCALGDTRPQSVGSAITYLRRYALASMIGLAADEDDDAQKQQQGAPVTSSPRPAARPATPPASRPALGKFVVEGTVVRVWGNKKPYGVIVVDDAGVEHRGSTFSDTVRDDAEAERQVAARVSVTFERVESKKRPGEFFDNLVSVEPVLDTPLTKQTAQAPEPPPVYADDIPF